MAAARRSLNTEESASLKGEVDKFRDKYAKQLSETVRVKTEVSNTYSTIWWILECTCMYCGVCVCVNPLSLPV